MSPNQSLYSCEFIPGDDVVVVDGIFNSGRKIAIHDRNASDGRWKPEAPAKGTVACPFACASGLQGQRRRWKPEAQAKWTVACPFACASGLQGQRRRWKPEAQAKWTVACPFACASGLQGQRRAVEA
jgi:hypothetical protein